MIIFGRELLCKLNTVIIKIVYSTITFGCFRLKEEVKSREELTKDVDELEIFLKDKVRLPVVFSHQDVWAGNMVHDEDKGEIFIRDFTLLSTKTHMTLCVHILQFSDGDI